MSFQSTPVIANGRIASTLDWSACLNRFQSTPVIANGRIALAAFWSATIFSFNPRPLLLTGESLQFWPGRNGLSVSIHARYC